MTRIMTKQDIKPIEVAPVEDIPSFKVIDKCLKHRADVSRLFYPAVNGQIDLMLQTEKGMWFRLTQRNNFLEVSYGHHNDVQKDNNWVRAHDWMVARNIEKERSRARQAELDAITERNKAPDKYVAKAIEDDVI